MCPEAIRAVNLLPSVKCMFRLRCYTEHSLYPEEGRVMVLLHVGDLQVLQDHSAVAVGLHHVQVVVLSGAQKV